MGSYGSASRLVTEEKSQVISKHREVFLRGLQMLILIAACFCSHGCSSPPQVVNDEECFAAVEALWTAITTKRSDLLEQTADELHRLQLDGKLSEEGHEALNEIIQTARHQEWMPAAKSLKTFMLGQRKS